MAGLYALSEGFELGRGFRCPDGALIEPLEYFNLLFPNHGFRSVGENVCFQPRPFSIPPLLTLLPEEDEFFLPGDLIDSLVCLALVTTLITISMAVLKWTWCKLDPRFAAVTPTHKQWYVVANLCKAASLALLSFSTRFWIGVYRCIHLDQYVNLEMKRCVIIYIANDVAALFMVPRLPGSTILHHVATAGIALIDCAINLTLPGWSGLLGVAKMSLIYGIISTPNFMVNAYLGLRVVYPKAKWGLLVSSCMFVYIACCAVNWTMHAYWLAGLAWSWDISVYTLLYLLPVSAMVHDDVVLIKWLWRHTTTARQRGGQI